MDDALTREVWRRAANACEYCRMLQGFYPVPFEIDHIIALQHGGPTILSNLALCCIHCNSHKGPNIAGLDPQTKRLTKLYNPRRHRWKRHFQWAGAHLIGLTAVGRTTILVLNMNGPFLKGLREALLAEGMFPPP